MATFCYLGIFVIYFFFISLQWQRAAIIQMLNTNCTQNTAGKEHELGRQNHRTLTTAH